MDTCASMTSPPTRGFSGVGNMNLLTAALIRVERHDGTIFLATLPGVFAAAMTDEVATFSALRPHQRHALHAFLVQIGTVAMVRAGLTLPPSEEGIWRDLLRGLTPAYEDDAPWCLVTAPDRPALLQSPLPNSGAGLKNLISTPDELDMLVTSRNHELKSAVMTLAEPDDWLFALVTLQTMEGFLGAGNYGISRMNGGFANRPAIGLAPPGGPGAHVRRDIERLLDLGGRPLNCGLCAERDGLVLVWLRPWDGVSSLSQSELDPLYVEVCRRVRLEEINGRITARVGGSKAARIAPVPGGETGDPWTPIRPDKEGRKALTVDGRGFSYRPLVDLLYPRNGDPSLLQKLSTEDAEQGLALVARALVRGQGKTEGYHERRVPLSRKVRRMGPREIATDPAAALAHQRVAMVSEMSGALRFALLALFENGPDKVDVRNDAADRKARTFLARFEREVDLGFFDSLWRELDEDKAENRLARRTEWVWSLLRLAERVLDEADRSGPKATRRRYRARVRSRGALQGAARRPGNLIAPMLKEPINATS